MVEEHSRLYEARARSTVVTEIRVYDERMPYGQPDKSVRPLSSKPLLIKLEFIRACA
jgi:hypothetical protein